MDKEKIVGVAIKFGDMVVCLPKPNRHHHVINVAYETIGNLHVYNKVQGFITNEARFVDRIEAKEVAIKADQLLPRAMGGDELFSECVW